jgi:very-short-patch-repair endonuclease
VDVCRLSSWPDRLVAEIAAAQLGLTTRWQLLDLGLSRAIIDHALARGRIIPVHRGVYAVGHVSLPPRAPFMAAVLAVGPGAVVSHCSAAALWGLVPSCADDQVDILLAGRDAGRRRQGIRVHRTPALHPRDATTYEQVPMTTPARALLDITPVLSQPQLEKSFDAGLKGRILTRHGVAVTVARSPDCRGAARLGALAESEFRGAPDTRSPAEEDFLKLVRAGGLPEPEMNARVGLYVIDALWRRLGLAVEIDGYEFHSTKRSFESDHERDQVMTDAGFAVLRFTRDQIVKQPELVLVRLTRRLWELEAQSGRSSRMVS